MEGEYLKISADNAHAAYKNGKQFIDLWADSMMTT